MSDFTDDMLNGDYCQTCGEYLGEGDGYPVTCEECQNEKENK